jgi:hypothetical protein
MKKPSVRIHLNRSLSSESGMGILQMLILVAVSGVLIASIASALVNMMKSSQTVAQSLEENLFTDQVSQVLANDGICSTTVTPFTPDLTGGSATPRTFTLPFASGNVVFDPANPVISDNFEIQSVTNRVDNTVAPTTILYNAATIRHYESVLSIQLRKRNTSTFVQSLKPFDIRLHLMVDATNQAIGCSAVSSASQACVAEGGMWNPLAADGQKCVSVKYCQYGGSYADAAEADGGFINTLTSGRSCPNGFTPQQSGTINKAISTGKYTVSNQPSKIYTCMRCGTALAAAEPAYPAVVPQADVNKEIYDAVATQQETDASLAEADTRVAYNNWQTGVTQSNSYQAQIDSANAAIANANAGIANEQAAYDSATAAYNSASTNYNNAAAIPDAVRSRT